MQHTYYYTIIYFFFFGATFLKLFHTIVHISLRGRWSAGPRSATPQHDCPKQKQTYFMWTWPVSVLFFQPDFPPHLPCTSLISLALFPPPSTRSSSPRQFSSYVSPVFSSVFDELSDVFACSCCSFAIKLVPLTRPPAFWVHVAEPTKVLIVCNWVTVILSSSVSNNLLTQDLVSSVPNQIVHHCEGLWLIYRNTKTPKNESEGVLHSQIY